jgi:hypothetical protein
MTMDLRQAYHRKTPFGPRISVMLSEDGQLPTLKSLVDESVPEERPSRPEPFTTTHLKTILHNSKLLLDLYRQGHEDPESSPDLLPFEPKHPIDFYRRFASGEESRMIAEIEEIGPELHAFRIKHQDMELAKLKQEAKRGLEAEVDEEVVVPGNEGESGVSEEQYVDLAEHKSSNPAHDEQALEHISPGEGMDADRETIVQDTTAATAGVSRGDPAVHRTLDPRSERGSWYQPFDPVSTGGTASGEAFYSASERERMPKYQPFGPPSTGQHACGDQCYVPFNFGTGRLANPVGQWWLPCTDVRSSPEQRNQLSAGTRGAAEGDPRFGNTFGFNHPVPWPQGWALLDIKLTLSVQEYLAVLHFPDSEVVSSGSTGSTEITAADDVVPADGFPSPFQLEIARLVSSPSIPDADLHDAGTPVTFPNESQQPYRQEQHEAKVQFGNGPSDAVELDAAPLSSPGSANTTHELDSSAVIVPPNQQNLRQPKPAILQFGAFAPTTVFDDADPIPSPFMQQTFDQAVQPCEGDDESQVAAAPEKLNHSAAAFSPAQKTSPEPEPVLPVMAYDDSVYPNEAQDLNHYQNLVALYHDIDTTLAPYQTYEPQRPASPEFFIPAVASRAAVGPMVKPPTITDPAEQEVLRNAQSQWWAAQTALNARLRSEKYGALDQLRNSGVTLLDPLPQRYKTEALIGLDQHVRSGSQSLGLEYGVVASGPATRIWEVDGDDDGDGDHSGNDNAGNRTPVYGNPVPVMQAPALITQPAPPVRIPVEMMPPQVQNRIQNLAFRPQPVNRSSTIPPNGTPFTPSPSPANVPNPDLNIPRMPRAMMRKAQTLDGPADRDGRRAGEGCGPNDAARRVFGTEQSTNHPPGRGPRGKRSHGRGRG